MTQVVYGITSGLGQLGAVGNFGHNARQTLQRLGPPGLDAGMGCGVGIGYGFGAGLMLKPSAVQQAQQTITAAAGTYLHAHAQLLLFWPSLAAALAWHQHMLHSACPA